jgi:GNAT superfamily N-acetyltransferase
MEVRPIQPDELELAGSLLYEAFGRAATERGFPPAWRDVRDSIDLVGRCREADPELTVVASSGGALVGVGAARVRGEVASIGPIAVAADGRGIGGAILDDLLARVDDAGVFGSRLYADAWNPRSYALYAGRGFTMVDLVAHIERPKGAPAMLDSARGLDVREVTPDDMEAIAMLDHKLTGHERRRDLEASIQLVARRRGSIVGYLGASGSTLGPALAVDVSDLFILIAKALALGAADADVTARLSTAPQTAAVAALAMGFRVRELGVVLSRGASPPTRPPQLYSIEPEIL